MINVILGLVDIRVKYYSYYFFSYLNIIFLIKCNVVNYHPIFIVVNFIYLFYFILFYWIVFYFIFLFIFGFFYCWAQVQIRPKNALGPGPSQACKALGPAYFPWPFVLARSPLLAYSLQHEAHLVQGQSQ